MRCVAASCVDRCRIVPSNCTTQPLHSPGSVRCGLGPCVEGPPISAADCVPRTARPASLGSIRGRSLSVAGRGHALPAKLDAGGGRSRSEIEGPGIVAVPDRTTRLASASSEAQQPLTRLRIAVPAVKMLSAGRTRHRARRRYSAGCLLRAFGPSQLIASVGRQGCPSPPAARAPATPRARPNA